MFYSLHASVYLRGPLRSIGTDNDLSIRFRRLAPQLPPPTWNVHQPPMYLTALTSQ